MTTARLLWWPLGLAILALTAPMAEGFPSTTYGGSSPALLLSEVAASVALLTVASLQRPVGAALPIAVVGAVWTIPEVAGWTSGPAVVSTAADAATRALPALVGVGLLARRAPGRAGRLAIAAMASGGLVAAASRLLLVDPFLDADCWRRCDPNPLLISGTAGAGPWLEAAGIAFVAAGAVVAGTVSVVRGSSRLLGRRAELGCAAAVAGGMSAATVLRLVRPELPDDPAYLATFVVAQAGAVVLAVLVLRERAVQWRLRRRLTRLAGALESAPAPGTLAAALRAAVGDPGLQVLYWAPARDRYVDATGVSAGVGGGGQRVTLVQRRGRPVAALSHSAAVDGGRVDRALGAAMRLALENEQLRAAALAELRELTLSRARIVERGQLERRRLERNLHDGAQQRVVSLALLVRMLASRLDGGGGELAARAESLTRATVEELRRVARGIYPAVLADTGLAGAVLDLAESSTDLPVALDRLPGGRYTGPVEATAYLVVAAAVAEARRCGATHARICADEQAGLLLIKVRDDAAPGSRPSVVDLADQVQALGGEVAVEPADDGTRVRLELPCAS